MSIAAGGPTVPEPDAREHIDLSDAPILLVDDNTSNLQLLQQALEPEGYRVFVATNAEQALRIARDASPELILLDVVMPGTDGLEVCRQLKRDAATSSIPVVFVTARDAAGDIVHGFDAGGIDYVVKPFNTTEVRVRARTHLQLGRVLRSLEKRNRQLEEETAARAAVTAERNQLSDRLTAITDHEIGRWDMAGFIGSSATIKTILETVELLQNSDSVSVLLTGESGTGKELVARALHFGSLRRAGPFVPVNCSAIPTELAESMLFGHERGAFTGAESKRPGYFALAHEGTLFLDEIGDLDLALQSKLLRVLEDGIVVPVGASSGVHVDVRIVAATNIDLTQRVSEHTFRQDLYFRIAGFPVSLPPLRDRTEDIEPLADHFLDHYATDMGVATPRVSADALAALTSYHFPGNVRELRNLLERALIELRGGDEVRAEHLRFLFPHPTPVAVPPASHDAELSPDAVPLDLERAEEFLIHKALQMTDGNISAAARLLGTNRPHIYRALKKQRSD